jgi:hypothetical protein
MEKTRLFNYVLILFLFVGIFCSIYPASATEVYFNNFSTAVGLGWSSTTGTPLITTAPYSPNEKFLGTDSTSGISNNTLNLSLGLLPHTDLTISFDLYIIHSWDGNGPTDGPDHWSLAIDNNPALLDTTFAMDTAHEQSYPGDYLSSNPAHTGRTANDTLKYSYYYGTNDTYHLSYTIPHTEDNVVIHFSAWGLQGLTDESWGLDNVRVETTPIPIPGSLLILGTGLLGLGGSSLWRRRRS